MRAPAVVVLAVAASVAILGQAQAPAFDVASVKENRSASVSSSMSGPAPGRFTIVNYPLRFIMLAAFELKDHQLLAAPPWTEEARFDITATYPDGSAPERDWRPMLQTLLADRFGLVVHRETREVPTYDLVLARNDGTPGPRLVRSDVDCTKPQAGAGRPSPVAPGGMRPVCAIITSRQSLSAGTMPIQSMLGPLQSLTGRPIVDRTGLTGSFDIDMQWTTAGDLSVGDPSAGDGVSIFAALQEQLGLKLEPSRAPFEVVIVDAVQRPTPD